MTGWQISAPVNVLAEAPRVQGGGAFDIRMVSQTPRCSQPRQAGYPFGLSLVRGRHEIA